VSWFAVCWFAVFLFAGSLVFSSQSRIVSNLIAGDDSRRFVFVVLAVPVLARLVVRVSAAYARHLRERKPPGVHAPRPTLDGIKPHRRNRPADCLSSPTRAARRLCPCPPSSVSLLRGHPWSGPIRTTAVRSGSRVSRWCCSASSLVRKGPCMNVPAGIGAAQSNPAWSVKHQ
jgi:hypothetical protein